MYEINRLIEDKKRVAGAELESEDEIIEAELPDWLKNYKDCFSKEASDEMPPHRKDVDLKIELEPGADPVKQIGHAPLYKLTLEELEAVKQYLEANLEKGFIVPSSSPFASPILIAHTGQKLRFCVDFRRLNTITKRDQHPLPLIDELMDHLNGARYFTKLDIRQGFHRIRIDPEYEDLTTFRTRYGTYKYRVVPFGLTNAPACFQRFVNGVFFDYLDKFMTAYIDDLLIYSRTLKEHKQHVRMVLERLRSAGLQASIRKCEFAVQRTKYLGFIITTEGIEVDPEKVAVIANWKIPTTVKGVQSFLGFGNFYRRFVRDYSRITRPLHNLTKKDAPFIWSPACQAAFKKLKERLINAPVLRHYSPERETRIETDASDGVVAGVMSQRSGDEWHPVAFYSKTMNGAEQNYDIHDKEMLAVIRALQEWRAELEGLHRNERFKILTDHRALEYFMTTKKLSARQARWAEFLSRFYFEIRYRPGKANTLADALSRPESSPELHLDKSRMQVLIKPEYLDPQIRAEASITVITPVEPDVLKNPLTERILALNRTALSLASLRDWASKEGSPYELKNEILTYNGRLVLPVREEESLVAELLREIHEQASVAHPGEKKTIALVKARYWWPTYRIDTIRFVRNCHACNINKIPRDKTPGLLKPLPIPEHAWQDLSVDFMDAPMTKNGHDAMLVIVCRLSKKSISIPTTRKVDSRELARLFTQHVYRHYGAPDSIVSDRGPQFISDFWNEFTKALGIRLKLSTAHHAQTDGQTEVMNQYIATRLRPYVNHHQDDWDEWLPIIDHASAIAPNASTGVSPFLAANGYEPRTSFDWRPLSRGLGPGERMNRQAAQQVVKRMKEIWDSARTGIKAAQESMERQANRHRREPDFNVGDSVYLTLKPYKISRPSRKLAEQNAGPFEIIKKIGNAYKLRLPPSMKIHPVFSPDKLRKAPNDPLPGQRIAHPSPVEINGELEWEIDRILASRLYYGKLRYRVKWKGFDEDPKWYPARNFKGSPNKIQEFHDAYPEAIGPPKRLEAWIKAYKTGTELEDELDDDLPA
jgi:hypothetical protein